MIEIRMDTKRLKMKIEGHAQPEECDDHTLVCNAASVLAQGLVYSCKKYSDEKQAAKEIKYRPDRGDMFFLVIPEKWAEVVFRAKFRTYADGLMCLAENRPESVTMILDGKKIEADKEDEA